MTNRRAVRFALVAVVATGLAIVAGSWAGSRVSPPPERAAPAPLRVVSVGDAKLRVPAGWRSIPFEDLDPRRAVAFAPSAGSSARIVAEFGPPTDASLLPPGLRKSFTDVPSSPSSTRLAGQPAWLYDGDGFRPDVTVVATTAGVLALACDGCSTDVSAAVVPGATTLVPSPSLALGLRLPAVLDRLDRDRRIHRAALARSATGRPQARAARRLTADHATAATALRPSAGTAGRRLVASLSATATAYGTLARAASNRWRSRFIAARQRIQRSEAALTAAIADVPRPREAPTVRPKPAPAPIVDIPAPGGVSLLVFAALALLAAAAGVAVGTTGAAGRLRQLID